MSEIEIRLDNIMVAIGNSNYVDAAQSKELFNINNIIFPHIKEFGTGCGSCRERVYNRLKTHWININKKED